MTDTVELNFATSEGRLDIPTEVVDTIVSPHTGKTLKRLSSELTVMAAEARSIAALLESPQLLDVHGDEWTGRIEAESYRDVQGLHSLTIGWEEQEVIHADAVEFAGLSLKPLHYEERADEEAITIAFRARLTPKETETLRGLADADPYFPVIRRGVSDELRQMRLGRVLWQVLTGGDTEQDITLVDEAYDSKNNSSFAGLAGEPQMGHLLRAVEQLLGERDALLDILTTRGVLDETAIGQVRQAGTTRRGTLRYRFYEVDDLSKWE